MSEVRFGEYRVMETIGSGAVSSLYKAMHDGTRRVVALKALKSTIASTSSFALQLEREARVLADLVHPNIVLLIDYVRGQTANDRAFAVLEFIDGPSLRDLLRKRNRLRADVVAALGAQITGALAHAHHQGVVHRDIKPENLMLTKQGVVKVIDFSIAQRDRLPSADEPHALVDAKGAVRMTEALGTPAYMSPEQLLGERVDERSDLFSLGVVLYRCLAGVRPFESEDAKRKGPAGVARRERPLPIHARIPEVPRALEQIVMRLLEKHPRDRFPSAEACNEALVRFLRTRTADGETKVVRRALTEAGFVRSTSQASGSTVVPLKAGAKRTVAGLACVGILFVGAGIALEPSGRAERAVRAAGREPLALVPRNGGGLRATATPWAEVWIDGQKIDTTPFARVIPLAPGPHFVTFVHPNARPEKRAITVNGGEVVTLDVTLDLSDGGVP